ncbi:hypothetical protein [Prevotella disiens]|uniref:hypothetical protein n=1 Tax=Prevotella disiens TaxID=28130 RepID=UPI002889E0D0|nr:hypothetical protein [Prevotella disiens]
MIAQNIFSVKRAAKDGQAALTLHVSPSSFVFETDDKGKIQATALNANKGSIYLYDGLKPIKPDTIQVKPYNCNASVNGNVLSFDSINPNQVCGKVEITATYIGQIRTAIAEFYVSKQRWNDAEFTTIKGKFESIQEEFERVDDEITDTKSTFNQLPEKITFEVLRHENGINLIKGGSLEYPELLDLRNHPEYITINNYGNLCKKSITLKRGYVETDDHTVAYFPRQTLKANTDYTISCWVRSDGYLYISCPLRYTFDGPPIDWVQAAPPNTNGKYQHFEFTFNTGVNTFAHFYLSARRNVNATVTDLQLEEGKKATSWTNPDKYERFRRAGIDLDLERIILQANKVYIRNSKGEQTAAIDQDGNLIAGTLRTKDNGGGYIYMHDNLQEYYKHGANHPSRRIGYIGNDWVDQRLSDDGNVIWEMNERGIVHYQTPERWVHVSDAYITTIEDIKKFFLINQGRTLYLIFNSSNHKSATLKEYVAARDVNGNIISSAGVTVEEGQANDGKLFYTSQYNGGFSLGGRFNLDDDKFSSPFTGLILATKPMHYYPFNNQSGQIAIPPEYTKFRQLYGVEDYYYVDFNRPVEWAYVNIYHLGRRIGSHRMFRNK